VFAFQAWEKPDFKGRSTEVYQEEGFYDINFTATSYIWLPNTTNCCVTFCKNTTKDLGYYCDARRRNEASSGFPRFSLWCGRKDTSMQKRCAQ
jgi:hypothetical protein